ncbi:MAG: hypothetical protein QS98_C0001G0010 [archaeon GW2011_AR3]|nr:MAG: hypothetical protein QS98_C0001G0010 [archaeon GW2011_AR3]MBS3109288.1 DNA repair exonuclease [Candidatus Woesearchaeota archaeon]
MKLINMKFAHMADCHVGSWRDPRLRYVSTEAFCRALDAAIERKVDFIIIAGDLFNTSLPPLDSLKVVAKRLKELKDIGIPVYIVAGSHDYSPSGKTMLDVLESADLLVNVTKGEVAGEKLRLRMTTDKKTGAKITGILGRRNMLERAYFESLDRESLEKEKGFKIFVFHTALNELKKEGQEHLDSNPISIMPKGFDYYAGGHVHMVFNKEIKEYGRVVYPGPLFPNSFSEIEELHHGGFYIYEDGKMEFVPIKIFETLHLEFDCDGKTPEQVRKEIGDRTDNEDLQHKIVTLRLFGNLSGGKISDININETVEAMMQKKAYVVLKNTFKLGTESFEEIKIHQGSVEEIESKVIAEHLGQLKIDGMNATEEQKLVLGLMKALTAERNEGERVADFERRIKDDANRLMKI